MKKSFVQRSVALALAALLFCLQPVCVVSAAESQAGDLRELLQHALSREGFIGSYQNGQDLQRGISAYLWDNRNWLQRIDFHNARQIDAVVCLLDKKGYPGFAASLKSEVSRSWCDNLVRQP